MGGGEEQKESWFYVVLLWSFKGKKDIKKEKEKSTPISSLLSFSAINSKTGSERIVRNSQSRLIVNKMHLENVACKTTRDPEGCTLGDRPCHLHGSPSKAGNYWDALELDQLRSRRKRKKGVIWNVHQKGQGGMPFTQCSSEPQRVVLGNSILGGQSTSTDSSNGC